jgi:putative tricarboxylic transport membrane protein
MRIDDRLFGVLICLLGIAVVRHSAGFPGIAGQYYGPALFPTVIGWGLVACGLVLLGAGLRRAGLRGPLLAFPDWLASPRGLLNVVLMLGAIVAFVLVGDLIGFQILAFSTLFLLYLTAGRSLARSLGAALVVTVLLELLFGRLLRVPLPRGLLTDVPWF